MYKNASLFFLIILIITWSCEKTREFQTGDVVINELMPVNSTIVMDQNGEYDDWIELYNLTPSIIDISGYYLSDNKSNISKWQVPQGITIPGNGFIIIWADKDTAQIGLHSNFKLSSLGEKVLLSKPDGTLIDEVVYPGQTLELSYSRIPNGTGTFRWQNPTYKSTNTDTK